MKRYETSLFIFDAINRESGQVVKLERHGTSRFNAWQNLEKEKGKSYHIIWS